MIQTEPDYGEPQFNHSRERIGDWLITIQTANDYIWIWTADRSDGGVSFRLTGQGEGLVTYEAAKAECMSVLESLTPSGFLPKSYVSTEDARYEIHRLENGRWVCLRDGVVGEHNFATASLAAAAHAVESYGDEE